MGNRSLPQLLTGARSRCLTLFPTTWSVCVIGYRLLDCEVLGLDWTAHLGKARALVGGAVGGPGKALQGNLDPNVLFAPPAQIEQQVQQALASFGAPHCDRSTCGPTHIFNLGHGISQFTPPEHVTALVEAVHRQSRALRQAQTFSQLATP